MPVRFPLAAHHPVLKKRNFGALYTAMMLLSLHWAVIVYMNSSYLEQFTSKATVGVLYTLSSVATVFAFLFITRLLGRIGNYTLTIILAILEFVALAGMAASHSFLPAALFFMLHNAVMPLLLFGLDVFMEELIGDEENTTGGRRGLYLGIMSFAGAIAPLASAFLIDSATPRYDLAYIAAALIIIPFILLIMRYFKTFADPVYTKLAILPTIKTYWKEHDVRFVFFAHFCLQIFFAWMIIYTPLYLVTVMQFSWSETGIILFAGLIAYVFLEYPIGIIADTYIGEKEMMALGFVIMAVSTSWFAFLGHDIGAWMLAMFATRVGASFVETTTESYFFKHTKGSDASIISYFRITRPLSYVIGASIGSLLVIVLPFNLTFIALGLLMVPGLFFTMELKDTK